MIFLCFFHFSFFHFVSHCIPRCSAPLQYPGWMGRSPRAGPAGPEPYILYCFLYVSSFFPYVSSFFPLFFIIYYLCFIFFLYVSSFFSIFHHSSLFFIIFLYLSSFVHCFSLFFLYVSLFFIAVHCFFSIFHHFSLFFHCFFNVFQHCFKILRRVQQAERSKQILDLLTALGCEA